MFLNLCCFLLLISSGAGAGILPSPTRKRPYEVGHEDDTTLLYFHGLNSVHLPSAEALKGYLANENNVQRFPIDRDVGRFDYWHEYFVSKACTVVESGGNYCEALSNSLVAFACSPSDVSPRSENSIITFMDLALRLIEHLARRPRERNVTNKTSGRYKPDSFIPMGVNGAACVTVEEKPLWMYKQGVMGSDPDHENLHKVDFNNWRNLYGNCPYIICFSVIADPSIFMLKMGVIEFFSRQNVELNRWDLRVPGARAQFAFKLVQMLPVLKAIIEGTEAALIPMIRLTNHSADMTITKTIQAIQCPALGVVLVEKEWSFQGGPGAPPRVQAQFDRMSSVFTRIGDSNLHDRYGVLKRVTHDNLSFHTVFDPTGQLMGMKGFFSPYGVQFNPSTPKELIEVILSVALIVQFLQVLGIVHNDIRWSNLCAVELPEGGKPVRMLLFDFDDAYVLDAGQKCPGLDHLSEEEHPLKAQVEHGGEVDVWALGMLICQHAMSSRLPALRQLGERVKECFESMGIVEVVEILATLCGQQV